MTRSSTGTVALVEDADAVRRLRDIVDAGAWARPVMADPDSHPSTGSLSMIYVSEIDSGTDAVVPVDHHETMPAPAAAMEVLSGADPPLMCPDKSALMQSTDIPEHACTDASLISWWENGMPVRCGEALREASMRGVVDPTWHTPIYAIVDALREEADAVSALSADVIEDEGFRMYDARFIPALAFLESEGIHVDREAFHRHFGDKGDVQVHDGVVHPRYHLYTSTGRPSNAFNRVNYAALEKGAPRDSFVSRYPRGRLFELDYDGFHLRLIADLVGYEFGEGSVHRHLGARYFGDSALTPEQYEESKQRSFSFLYGHIPDEALQYTYFRRVQAFIDEVWALYNREGGIATIGCGRVLPFIQDATPNKVFNYLLQSYETEVALNALASVMDAYTSVSERPRVCLYTYDSFLLDVPPGCEADVARMRRVLSYGGKYPMDVQSGPTYGALSADDRFA